MCYNIDMKCNRGCDTVLIECIVERGCDTECVTVLIEGVIERGCDTGCDDVPSLAMALSITK